MTPAGRGSATLLMLGSVFACACTNDASLAELRAAVDSLRSDLGIVSVQEIDTQLRLDSLVRALNRNEFFDALEARVVLDPADQGFSILDTRYGPLTFRIVDVTPFGDGSRVAVDVGNLTSATINGGQFRAEWGPRFDANIPDSVRAALRRDGTLSFTTDLVSGTWNRVTFNLGGVPPAQLGVLRLEFAELPGITLNRPR